MDYLSAAGAIGAWAGIPKQSVHEEISQDVEPMSLDNMVVFEEGGEDVVLSSGPAQEKTAQPLSADAPLPAVFRVNDKGELIVESQP